MFEFLANVLTFFYSVWFWPSYGVMIILLTLSVRIVFTPLTVRGTKSMLEMRRVQPQMRALQKKYKHDRAQLNLELQALYREHKINPLGGCLPLLAQAPVFLVLYQVLRGLTRRTSDLGKSLGWVTSNCNEGIGNVVGPVGPASCSVSNPTSVDSGFFDSTFFPRYLDAGSALFKDLSSVTEMLWLGIDLSLSPSDAISRSLVKALPYLVMILIVAVLGFLQQRQIAGRNPDAEINPMQKTLMRILPIFLPVISFSLPAGLIVYFITTSGVGIAQQAFITHRVYKPWNEEEKNRPEVEVAELEESAEAGEAGSQRSSTKSSQTAPQGLLGKLMSGTQPADKAVHGRKRPTSVKPAQPKKVPPKAAGAKTAGTKTNSAAKPTPPADKGAAKGAAKGSTKGSAKAAPSSQKKLEAKTSKTSDSKKADASQTKTREASSRVTLSKKEIEAQKQTKKRRRN